VYAASLRNFVAADLAHQTHSNARAGTRLFLGGVLLFDSGEDQCCECPRHHSFAASLLATSEAAGRARQIQIPHRADEKTDDGFYLPMRAGAANQSRGEAWRRAAIKVKG